MPDLQPLNPPAGSTLRLDVRPDGVTLRVPRQPIRKAAKGLFSVSLLWLGFIAVFTGIFVAASIFDGGESNIDWSDWRDVAMAGGFLCLFWAIGLGMLLASINASRREAIVDVIDRELIVTRRSLLGTRQHVRHADDITFIHRAATGTTINNVPVQALDIESRGQKRLRVFSHLSNAEIDYVVDLLRRVTGVAAAAEDDDKTLGLLGEER